MSIFWIIYINKFVNICKIIHISIYDYSILCELIEQNIANNITE